MKENWARRSGAHARKSNAIAPSELFGEHEFQLDGAAMLPSCCPEGGGGACRPRLNGVVVDRADRAEIIAETPSNHVIVLCARPDFGFSAQVLRVLATFVAVRAVRAMAPGRSDSRALPAAGSD